MSIFFLFCHRAYDFPNKAISAISPISSLSSYHGAYDFLCEVKCTPPSLLFRRKSVASWLEREGEMGWASLRKESRTPLSRRKWDHLSWKIAPKQKGSELEILNSELIGGLNDV